jgi:hypothetical protein
MLKECSAFINFDSNVVNILFKPMDKRTEFFGRLNAVSKMKDKDVFEEYLFSKTKRSKILMLSGYIHGKYDSEQLKPWIQNKIRFARRNQIDFVFEKDPLTVATRDGRKFKPFWIHKWLENYEWVYWVDVDCVLQCPEKDRLLQQFLLYPTQMSNLSRVKWQTDTLMIGIGHPPGHQIRFSNFAFLIKSHQDSFRFLNYWKNWSLHQCSCWGDQGAMWMELVHWLGRFETYGECHSEALHSPSCSCNFHCFENTFSLYGYDTKKHMQPNKQLQFYFNSTGSVSVGMQNWHWKNIHRFTNKSTSVVPMCLHKKYRFPGGFPKENYRMDSFDC